ncbi:MAG TPA: inorganic diphosphatase [Xanthobacteraceae bacterium]|nr:inorganic diphosphatase [Xanthobacteraceae bacterium]
MDISRVSAGDNPPEEIHAFIEIPLGGQPVKYELDKHSGALMVDRFLHTAMYYPGNYGFIPQTLAADGDPLDVILLAPVSLVPGCVVPCRPIGVLMMTDEKGEDEKVLAVPADRVHPFYAGVRSYSELPPLIIEQVTHFFTHYKDLEPGKKVSVADWAPPELAKDIIRKAIAAASAYK